MNRAVRLSRRQFLGTWRAAAVAAVVGTAGGLRAQPLPRVAAGEGTSLAGWEFVEIPGLPRKLTPLLRIRAANGAVGYAKLLGPARELGAAATALGSGNLLDHAARDERMVARQVPLHQRTMLDVACWDLHARGVGQPLHALLGSRRPRVRRYGDVRGTQPGFTAPKYAESVARYLERTGMTATKLHFPGAMGTKESIPFAVVLETLAAVRAAVGRDVLLAWDPYPGSAESATSDPGEAREILRVMQELGYAWIEGPLPPIPFESQVSQYAELMRMRPRPRIQAEGPRSPIGDGTRFPDLRQWYEAGAIDQCSTDAYLNGGITETLRMLEYARARPGLVMNLHWAWAPHAHLAMAYDESVFPVAEFPMGEDVPKEFMSGPWLLAPDWPGVYSIPG